MPASPLTPEFWDQRYRRGKTPWDAAGAPSALQRYLAAHPGGGSRVLIPGCGSAYEVLAFANAGYDVSAIDFSPAAVAHARRLVGPELGSRVIEGDFFAHKFEAAPFDLIYERTFLCALPPEIWPKIVARSADLLKPGGRLVGIYFFGTDPDGPPFPLPAGETEVLFGQRFATIADEPIPPAESLPLFAGAERWQERQRLS